MEGFASVSVARVDSLVIPDELDSERRKKYQNLYGVLRIEAAEPVRRGDFMVRRAMTTHNRLVGVVYLPSQSCGGSSEKSQAAYLEIARRRLKAEFAALSRLRLAKCLPMPRGLGEVVDGGKIGQDGVVPVLIEDWVDGVNVADVPHRLARLKTETGAGALDVALVGEKLYRMLASIGRYWEGGVVRGVSATTATVLFEGDDILAAFDARAIDVGLTIAASEGCDPADILLGMLGSEAVGKTPKGDLGDERTRDERVALASIIRHGKWQKYAAAEMEAALARWIRLHDTNRLPADGTAAYPASFDYRILVPYSRKGERPAFNLLNNMHMEALDNTEQGRAALDDALAEMGTEPLGQRVREWFLFHFKGSLISAMVAYAAILFLIGWSLPLDLPA